MEYVWYCHKSKEDERPVLPGMALLIRLLGATKLGDAIDLANDQKILAIVHADSSGRNDWMEKRTSKSNHHLLFVSSAGVLLTDINEKNVMAIKYGINDLCHVLTEQKVASFRTSCENGEFDVSLLYPDSYPNLLALYTIALTKKEFDKFNIDNDLFGNIFKAAILEYRIIKREYQKYPKSLPDEMDQMLAVLSDLFSDDKKKLYYT